MVGQYCAPAGGPWPRAPPQSLRLRPAFSPPHLLGDDSPPTSHYPVKRKGGKFLRFTTSHPSHPPLLTLHRLSLLVHHTLPSSHFTYFLSSSTTPSTPHTSHTSSPRPPHPPLLTLHILPLLVHHTLHSSHFTYFLSSSTTPSTPHTSHTSSPRPPHPPLLTLHTPPLPSATPSLPHLVYLSLMCRHSFDSVFRHLFLFLLCVFLRNGCKRVVGVIITTVKVIPCTVQSLKEGGTALNQSNCLNPVT